MIISASVLGCIGINKKVDTSWFLENELDEEVEIEAYFRHSDSPSSALESGAYTLAPLEKVRLYRTTITPKNDSYSSSGVLSYFFEIDGVDSLVMVFEGNKSLSYDRTETPPLDSLNPLNYNTPTSTWELEAGNGFVFKIGRQHKEAAN